MKRLKNYFKNMKDSYLTNGLSFEPRYLSYIKSGSTRHYISGTTIPDVFGELTHPDNVETFKQDTKKDLIEKLSNKLSELK